MTIFGTSVKQSTGETVADATVRVTRMIDAKMLRIYLDRPEWTGRCQQAVDLGLKICVSFKVWPEQEAQLVAFLQRLPEGSIVIYWHEPDDDVQEGRVKLSTITSRTALLANLIVKIGLKGKIRPATCLMAWSLQPASGRDWRSFFPTSVVEALRAADGIIGWDAYAGKNAADGPDREVEALFGECLLAAKEYGLPSAIFETGARATIPMPAAVEKLHAEWWARAIAFAKRPRRFGVDADPFVCFLLWNSHNPTSGFDSRIDSLPSVITVWRRANDPDLFTEEEVDRLVTLALQKAQADHNVALDAARRHNAILLQQAQQALANAAAAHEAVLAEVDWAYASAIETLTAARNKL